MGTTEVENAHLLTAKSPSHYRRRCTADHVSPLTHGAPAALPRAARLPARTALHARGPASRDADRAQAALRRADARGRARLPVRAAVPALRGAHPSRAGRGGRRRSLARDVPGKGRAAREEAGHTHSDAEAARRQPRARGRCRRRRSFAPTSCPRTRARGRATRRRSPRAPRTRRRSVPMSDTDSVGLRPSSCSRRRASTWTRGGGGRGRSACARMRRCINA
jgi:hypothetical protein